ncbi:hypothetical protein [Spiroplasma endosymbiont of Labia minor]|uniref:hypothetical protein n=1 Tax=Spiroplasma endosymbiont of Labia minor TaxID=3066305 RepID=UPI0030D10892
MNKNKKFCNFAILKVLPLLLSLGLLIGIGYIVNAIPFINKLDKSDTIAIIAAFAVISAFIFFGLFYKAIQMLDKARIEKAIDAKLMLGHRIVSADISNAQDAKDYAKTKKFEMEKTIQEHNAAIRTVKHFEKAHRAYRAHNKICIFWLIKLK